MDFWFTMRKNLTATSDLKINMTTYLWNKILRSHGFELFLSDLTSLIVLKFCDDSASNYS